MEDTLTFGSALLTRTCRWNPVPRHATALPMDGAASLALVQDWLLQKGLPATEARIAQAFSVDLEDDGATDLRPEHPRARQHGSSEMEAAPLPEATPA